MSERILKALMQLFAIISESEDEAVSKDRRKIVKLFLKMQLNKELVDEYLGMFDNFLGIQSKKDEGKKKRKRTSVNSVKILRICTQINEELAQPQKVVVLFRLLEFVNTEGNPSEQEIEFVTTVAETFNISQDEYNRGMAMIQNTIDNIPESSKILIIDSKSSVGVAEVKHISTENINGQIRILHVPSINMYTLRYYGDGEYYLNGQVIFNDRIYILTNGSSIRGSKIRTIYYSDIVGAYMSDVSKDKITFEVKDLEFRFKAGNIGVQKLSMAEESGRMIGIMGGSGAGKSTLLNVLNGVEKPSEGQLLINGRDVHGGSEDIEGLIGFVPQDDLLMEDLTVYQNLYYAAKLCFGNFQDERIAEMCDKVLSDIGLSTTRNLKVGSPLKKVISGGQRKRLNIALELIREPGVLFLDEPTSGLSSRDSENIMDLLKELALKGKLIFVVIHQPSSEIFKMFDKLIILDVGGYPIYNGNPIDAIIYFKKLIQHVNPNESECVQCGNVNPEQIFNIIESKIVDEYGNLTPTRKVSPEQWSEYYREKIEPGLLLRKAEKESKIPKGTFKIPNKFKQIKVFIIRDVLSKLANTQYMTINLLEAPVLALAIAYFVKYYKTDVSNKVGYIFRENENIPIYMFMVVVIMLFIGLTMSAEEIIKDKKILKREAFLNLSKGGYLISKVSIMFLISAIQTISLILIGNSILEVQGMTWDYWIVLFSTACYANMLGLNISSAFNSAVTIYILIPFVLIPMFLFSGVMVKFDKLNPTMVVHNSVPFIGEMMVTRWAYEALSVNQFITNDFETEFYKYDKGKSVADFKKNFWIPYLQTKTEDCIRYIKRSDKENDLAKDLLLLKNELSGIGQSKKKKEELANFFPQEMIDALQEDKFNKNIGERLKDSLQALHHKYVVRFNYIYKTKNMLISSESATEEGRKNFLDRKNKNKNDALSDLVTNMNELDKILEVDGNLVQQADPIFLDPPNKVNVRAHFFAPRKWFLGKLYNTFWVNILVIWSMSFIFAITLYFDIFRKIIESPEVLFSKLGKLISPSK
ncbi:MAG TPA: ATP-binding cassette domain-containing protein [Flavobacteriales bacterium]|nr:ATP-binding cassette domain-containing protein [Flavobacteriales bacterium]HIN39005.1 ATP-binding cassette domain-containing protein [Flavobacteriales bacterium]